MPDPTEAPIAEPGENGTHRFYDAAYYHSHLGPAPYERNDAWVLHFGGVADGIVRTFAPRTVLDVGCAFGMLVEQLWDRGVYAEGVDVSDYAISQARPDMRPYLRVGRATEPLGGPFDLVTCVEVLEHLPEDEIPAAILRLTEASDRILFSSTPDDFDEPTHCSVKPPLAWIRAFADAGHALDLSADPTILAPHGLVFRRSAERQSDAIQSLYARLVRERVLADRRFGAIQAAIRDGSHQVAEANDARRSEAAALRAERDAAAARVRELEQRCTALSGRAMAAETAAEAMEQALGRAVETLESDADATREAVFSMDRVVNHVVTSPFWRLKRALTRSKS